MNIILHIALPAFLVILFADLAAGLVHWLQDAYIREDTPFLGKLLGIPNTIHHHLPRYMTHKTWLESSWDLLLICAGLILGARVFGCLTWHVWLFAAVSANANEIHKWAHRTRSENGPVISFLQDIRLLQTPRHHAIHHTNPKDIYYCPVTNVLNPVLEIIHFWAGLEWLLSKTVGLMRREDTSLPGNGSPPAWLPRRS